MYSFTVHFEGEEGAPVEAQVVQAHKGMSLRAVFDEVYELKLEGRLRTEMLIVRLPVDEQSSSVEIEQNGTPYARKLFGDTDPFSRVRDRSVHVLTSRAGVHVLTKNLNPNWPGDALSVYSISRDHALAAIQRAEFEHILERSRAVLVSPPGSKFRAPSGRFLRSFIRVGNIQYDRDAIDAVFFWMLPHLDGVGAILTDTWSISSIAFNIAKQAAAYFSTGPLPVEMLQSYHDGSDSANLRTRSTIERLNADFVDSQSKQNTLLCLISATQTGSLAKHLAGIFITSTLSFGPRFVALFSLGKTEIISLHDLSEDSRFAVLDNDSGQASQPISIDSQVYFPLQFEDAIIEIDKSVADKSRSFFDRYVSRGLITVHKTHTQDGGLPRHHGIHLETERLLDVPEFVSCFEQLLSGFSQPPSLIVCPPHQAGRHLAEHASAFFDRAGKRPRIFEHPNLFFESDSLSPEEVELRLFLKSAREDDVLLILDDVCITGTRLSQYQRYIRTEGYRGQIAYVVGIARGANLDIWSNLERYLSFRDGKKLPRHTVQCVDSILLPNWDDDNCPWCCERQLYESWQEKHKLPEILIERLALLSREDGLSNRIYLEFPQLSPMSLGPNSLFTNEGAHQAEVFAAVSAALQYLRTTAPIDRPVLGPRRFPISTVLNHVDYLRSKWTDSILRATFFRAASIEELTYASPEKESERVDALHNLISEPTTSEHDVTLEILLAANLGKCKIEVDDHTRAIVETFGAKDVSSYLIDRLTAGP